MHSRGTALRRVVCGQKIVVIIQILQRKADMHQAVPTTVRGCLRGGSDRLRRDVTTSLLPEAAKNVACSCVHILPDRDFFGTYERCQLSLMNLQGFDRNCRLYAGLPIGKRSRKSEGEQICGPILERRSRAITSNQPMLGHF
jgi:hypothetical protein